jgi:hypothetical protein
MPLVKSGSNKAISSNIKEMRASGHPQNQSVAAAMQIASKYRKGKGGEVTGPLMGATGGRADKLPLTVPDHSHVIPADVVSALGQGNTSKGMEILTKMFPPDKSEAVKMRSTKIMASDGEFIVTPSNVLKKGHGNIDRGHEVLDHFIVHTRKLNIHQLKHMPPPAKD